MGQPSSDWMADQDRAEREMVDRYTDLDAVLLRLEGYARRAEESAAALDRMPSASGASRRQEAADLRQLIAIAAHHNANLDRIHLIEEPVRDRRSGFRGGRA